MKRRMASMILTSVLVAVMGCNTSVASKNKVTSNDTMYDSGQYSKGDKVRSVFVYNPDTNYFDDFACRIDRLME